MLENNLVAAPSSPTAPTTSTMVGGNASAPAPPSAANGSASETPWGLKWSELLTTLRPDSSHGVLCDSMIEEVRVTLARAGIVPDAVVAGGAYGRATHTKGDTSLHLYAIFGDFNARQYLDKYQTPFIAALKEIPAGSDHVPFSGIEARGLSVFFTLRGMDVWLFAAGEFYGGPKQLILMDNAGDKIEPEMTGTKSLRARDVHMQTTCEVLRTKFLAMQPKLYKDLVRVARKWRDELTYQSASLRPSDYLLELVMLEAFQSSSGIIPCGANIPSEVYRAIFRRFLSTFASQSAAGAHTIGGIEQPKTFLAWTTLYEQGAIDYCITKRMLPTGDADLSVLDVAVPYRDVGVEISDWTFIRAAARRSLASFENHDLLESLQAKLHHFSVGVDETMSALRRQIDILAAAEKAPRRWSGTVSFSEMHLASDTWVKVMEIDLRCYKWHINVRRSRSDTTGYSRTADVSLQVVGLKKRLERTIDVDVHFQGHTAQLVFGPECDHVLISKRCEILRNREYAAQITVIA